MKRVMRIKLATALRTATVSLITAILYGCSQSKPTIEYGEFPFRFSFEMDGKSHTIEDTVICTYTGLEGMLQRRDWQTSLKSGVEINAILREENVRSVIYPERINISTWVILDYGHGGYYMGDPNADEMIHGKPHVCYGEVYVTDSSTTYIETTPLSNEQLKDFFGIDITEFDFTDPIINSFDSTKSN